ncbi:MAG: hypothetical protein IIA50_04450 [Bacteroidetes bacterium]|nr:hypothetical protein [Bacteroidota bacterium]
MMRTPIKYHRLITVLLTAAPIYLLASCDTSIEPFQEADLHFSIWGYLDAGADSQFVRVSPLRRSISLGDQDIDATVLLEDLESGAKTILRDSIFVFGEKTVHNYWTDVLVEHEKTYRLSVSNSAGDVSDAVVTLPKAFPAPDIALMGGTGVPPEDTPLNIKISGVDRLAAIKIIYQLGTPSDGSPTEYFEVSYLDRVAVWPDFLAVAVIPYDEFFRKTFSKSCPLVSDAWVVVASAGPGWPDLLNIDDGTLARPDVVTNVNNGVGFIGGISSKVFHMPELADLLAGLQDLCRRCAAGERILACIF